MALTVAELEGRISLEVSKVEQGAKAIDRAMTTVATAFSKHEAAAQRSQVAMDKAFDVKWERIEAGLDKQIAAVQKSLDLKAAAAARAGDAMNKGAGSATGLGDALGRIPGPIGEAVSATSRWVGLLTGPAGLVVGMAAVAAAGVGLATSLANDIERLDNLSRQTGLSVAALQAFEEAAKRAGEAPESLAMGLGKVNQAISDLLRGKDEAAKGFEAIGVPFKQLVRDGASVETILDLTAKRLMAIKDPTVQAAAGFDLFGLRGKAMQTVLAAISKDGVEGYIEAMRKLGIVTNEETLRTARDFDAMLDDMMTRARAFMLSLKTFSLEVITSTRSDIDQATSAIVANYTALLALIAKVRAAVGLGSQEAAEHAARVAAAAEEMAARGSKLMTPGQADARGERPPPQDAGLTPRITAPTAKDLAAITAADALRQKSIEDNAKAWGDFADQVFADDEKMLQFEQQLREARIQSASAGRKVDIKENLDAIDKATKSLDGYVVAIGEAGETTTVFFTTLSDAMPVGAFNEALTENMGLLDQQSEKLSGSASMANEFRRQLEGVPPSILAVRDASDKTWIETQQKIDEGVAALFRMKDALGPPMLTAFEQFSAGFKKIMDQLPTFVEATLQNIRGLWSGVMTDLTTAFQDSFVEVIKGHFKDLDDIWQGFLDVLLKRIIAFIAAEAVQLFIKLALSLAGIESGGGSGSGGGGGDFDWKKILGFLEVPQQQRHTVAIEEDTKAVDRHRIVLEEFSKIGAIRGAITGGIMGAPAGPVGIAIGALAGGFIGGMGGFLEMLGKLTDVLGLTTPAINLAQQAAMLAQIATLGLTGAEDDLTASASAAAQAGTSAMHALDRNTEVTGDLTGTVDQNTTGLNDLTDRMDVMSLSIENANAATEVATAGFDPFGSSLEAFANAMSTAVDRATEAANQATAAATTFDTPGTGGNPPTPNPTQDNPAGPGGGQPPGPSSGGPNFGGPPGPPGGGGPPEPGGPSFQNGGWVTAGRWNQDSVMARVARGEFVVSAPRAREYGAELEAINAGHGAFDRLRRPGGAEDLSPPRATGDGPQTVWLLLEQNRLLREQNELLRKLGRHSVPRGSVTS